MTAPSAEYTLESGIQALDASFDQSWWTSHSSRKDVFNEIRDLYDSKPLMTGARWISVLACDGWRFTLKEPIPIQESYEDNTWTRQYEPLGILAYGQSREEASDAFCEEFASCWREIACEEDGNLTVDALELKSKLHALVKDARLLE